MEQFKSDLMKVTDCYWEKENLNKSTIEISIEDSDIFSSETIEQVIKSYEYVVIKVPVNKTEINFNLTSMGFTMIETQFNISKSLKEFDYNASLIKHVDKHVSFEIISSKSKLEKVLSMMTIDMFTKDRIAIDPFFGPEFAYKRYLNWVRKEFEDSTSKILTIIYKGYIIGFIMFRASGGKINALLGGIFKNYQNYGLGILTASSIFLYAKKNNLSLKQVVTSISSNNMAVLQFYNYLNYKIDKMSYVFVKHL